MVVLQGPAPLWAGFPSHPASRQLHPSSTGVPRSPRDQSEAPGWGSGVGGGGGGGGKDGGGGGER